MNDLTTTDSPALNDAVPPIPVPTDTRPAALMRQTSNVTPGIRTTEFWSHAVVVVGCIVGALIDVLPAKWALIAAAVVSGCYNLSRALTKLGGNLW